MNTEMLGLERDTEDLAKINAMLLMTPFRYVLDTTRTAFVVAGLWWNFAPVVLSREKSF